MSRPGAPGTWRRDLWRAFTYAGSRRFGRTPPYRTGRILVTAAEPQMPWGRSTHAAGYLSHLVGLLTIGWRDGRAVGWAVRWRCGAQTMHFRLEAEPSGPMCPACTIDRTTTGRHR